MEIRLKDLPAFIQLLDAAFGDPDRVTSAEGMMREIKQRNREFSQYCTKLQVINAEQDSNHSAIANAVQIGLYEEMQDRLTYCDMAKELPALVSVWQEWDNQIRQRQTEMTALSQVGAVSIATSRQPPAPPTEHPMARTGKVAGYSGITPLNHIASKR